MVDSVNYPITLIMTIKYAIFDNQCGDRRPCMYLNVCTRVFKFVNDFDPDFFFFYIILPLPMRSPQRKLFGNACRRHQA